MRLYIETGWKEADHFVPDPTKKVENIGLLLEGLPRNLNPIGIDPATGLPREGNLEEVWGDLPVFKGIHPYLNALMWVDQKHIIISGREKNSPQRTIPISHLLERNGLPVLWKLGQEADPRLLRLMVDPHYLYISPKDFLPKQTLDDGFQISYPRFYNHRPTPQLTPKQQYIRNLYKTIFSSNPIKP